MSSAERKPELEVDENREFHRHAWIVERAGWTVMAAVVVLAGAGLFGRGPLGDAKLESPEIGLEYERFTRLHGPTELKVRLVADTTGHASVSLDRAYLRGVRIDQILPEPERVQVGEDRLVYRFLATQAHEPLEVVFSIEVTELGPRSGELGTGDGPGLRFRQFVYP